MEGNLSHGLTFMDPPLLGILTPSLYVKHIIESAYNIKDFGIQSFLISDIILHAHLVDNHSQICKLSLHSLLSLI